MAVYVLVVIGALVYVIFRVLNKSECENTCSLEVENEEPFGTERGDRQDR